MDNSNQHDTEDNSTAGSHGVEAADGTNVESVGSGTSAPANTGASRTGSATNVDAGGGATSDPNSGGNQPNPPIAQNPDVLNLINQGNSLVGLGSINDAITIYLQGLALAKQVGDAASQVTLEYNLGVAYNKINDPNTAIQYLLQAKDKITDPQSRVAILGHLGNAYLKLNDIPTAQTYYQQALGLARVNNDKLGEGASLSNIGVTYYRAGKIKEAIDYLQQAQAIQEKNGDETGRTVTTSTLELAKRDLALTQEVQQKNQTIEDLSGQLLSDQRYKLARVFVVTFALGLFFLGMLLAVGIINEAIKAAQGIAPSDKSFFSFDNMIQLITTFAGIVGTPLGFVLGYYFKGQEDKAILVGQTMGQSGRPSSSSSISGTSGAGTTSGASGNSSNTP